MRVLCVRVYIHMHAHTRTHTRVCVICLSHGYGQSHVKSRQAYMSRVNFVGIGPARSATGKTNYVALFANCILFKINYFPE